MWLVYSLTLAMAAPCISAAADTSATDSSRKITVALFDLESDDIRGVALRILTDVVRGELVRSDRFELIDRAHVEKVLQEQEFQATGPVSEATMVEMGQLVGVEKIVTGRIGWLGKVRVITLQLIDVSTGRVDRLEATDFIGEVEHMRRPVRAATQRLIGIGGFMDLHGGSIHIVSVPSGATVHVAGLYEGTTPLEVWVDSVGNYAVKVSSANHQDWNRAVYVGKGETTFLEPVLVSLTPSDIEMVSTPPGANIYVYGRFQGTTPVKVRVDSAGTYDVQMTKDNHHDWHRTVQVRIGEVLSVQAALVPVEVLGVSSTPLGGSVYVDGRFVGVAPVSVKVGSPGQYAVRVTRDGYNEWSETITIRPGGTPSVRAKLEPIEVVEVSRYVQTGRATLWGFIMPYSLAASEALIYAMDIKSEKPYIGAALTGIPATYFLMLRYTADTDISATRTSMIISSGLWGTAWGIMGGIATRDEDDGGNGSTRAAAALSVAASASAMAVAAHYTRTIELSGQRVAYINGGGFLGSVMGIGIPYLFDVDNAKILFGSLIVGGISGTIYSVYATRNMDRSDESDPDETTAPRSPRSSGLQFMRPVVFASKVPPSPTFGHGAARVPGSEQLRLGITLLEYRF